MSVLPQLRDGLLIIGQSFHVGGTAWAASYIDVADTIVSRGSADPVYVLQREPTEVEIALAGTAVPAARWRFIARATPVAAWVELDSITNGDLVFTVTSIDRVKVPGLALGTLELMR
jgi:hypothetical protein